jgi:hypothetical protein
MGNIPQRERGGRWEGRDTLQEFIHRERNSLKDEKLFFLNFMYVMARQLVNILDFNCAGEDFKLQSHK